jgi:hypothetical protein
MTSGAMYSGEPQSVSAKAEGCKNLLAEIEVSKSSDIWHLTNIMWHKSKQCECYSRLKI